MRRVDVTGGTLSLMDYCTAGPQYASGGFIADSGAGTIVNGSQQQWLTRNSEIAEWSNGVWNQVFAGVAGAPSDAAFPNPPYTTLATTPVSREKPYLFVDARGGHQVRVPSARTNTSGMSWAGGTTAGRTIPLPDFFVARPSDSAKAIDHALSRGRHLLLTPGVYDIGRTLSVKRPGTVVLGLGHATLTAARGAVPLTVGDVPGVIVAGVTIDAGPARSPVLLQVGKRKVGDRVRTHELYGGGVYVFNQNNPSIHTENGFEVPQTPGVRLHHIMTVNLSAGTIDHVVNGVGDAADTSRIGAPVFINDYP